MKQPSIIYIYGLADPRTNEIRYIGRTGSLTCRYKAHINKSKRKKTHRDCWIQSLLSLGFPPMIKVLYEFFGSFEESYEVEKAFINNYRLLGFDLTNHDDLGCGLKKIISKSQKEKISNSVKKKHSQGLLHCNRKAVDIYDLEANFICTKRSHIEAADFIGVSTKHLENSIYRKDKRIKNFIVVGSGSNPPKKWIYKKRSLPTKKFILSHQDLGKKQINSKKELNLFFGLEEKSSRLNYYIDSGRPYTDWIINRMPD